MIFHTWLALIVILTLSLIEILSTLIIVATVLSYFILDWLFLFHIFPCLSNKHPYRILFFLITKITILIHFRFSLPIYRFPSFIILTIDILPLITAIVIPFFLNPQLQIPMQLVYVPVPNTFALFFLFLCTHFRSPFSPPSLIFKIESTFF